MRGGFAVALGWVLEGTSVGCGPHSSPGWSSLLSTNTIDWARQLGGPDWLQAQRLDAANRFEEIPLPTAELEEWRYSRIGTLDLAQYRSPDLEAGDELVESSKWTESVGEYSALACTYDGRPSSFEVGSAAATAGLVVAPLAQQESGAEVQSQVAGEFSDEADALATLNEAGSEPILVLVPPGAVISEPIVIVHALVDEAVLAQPRVIVRVGADAEVSIVEIEVGHPASGLLNSALRMTIDSASRVQYLRVQDVGRSVWRIASNRINVGSQATFSGSEIALGGFYARTRTDIDLVGRGATGNLVAGYFGVGDQMLDFRTFQNHRGQDTQSNLRFHGALGGRSRSVYTGMIRIEPEARGSNAFQTNNNIKLSDDAWAESVPNLEIENNDVRCSHASTVGPVDADQRFYLESRGVPTRVAERLIVGGFFDAILTTLPNAGVAALVRDQLVDRFEEGVG